MFNRAFVISPLYFLNSSSNSVNLLVNSSNSSVAIPDYLKLESISCDIWFLGIFLISYNSYLIILMDLSIYAILEWTSLLISFYSSIYSSNYFTAFSYYLNLSNSIYNSYFIILFESSNSSFPILAWIFLFISANYSLNSFIFIDFMSLYIYTNII